MSTLAELLQEAALALEAAGIEGAQAEARFLLEDCFSIDRSRYYMERSREAGMQQAARYRALWQRRAGHEPLQYLLGTWDFYGSTFFVGEGVLIPRPETEELAEAAIQAIRKNGCKVCFDLCAGSGCIGLSIAKACPDTQVFLLEKYDAAFSFLQKNMDAFALPNVTALRYDVLEGFDPQRLPRPDILVSNPPYIESGELPGLQAEVQHEPMSALDGGADGLLFYRAIASLWAGRLAPRPHVLLETGEGQPQAVAALLRSAGLTACTHKDIYTVERFVFAFYNTEKEEC